MSELGIKERRVGHVTVLETDALMRINLRFGKSSVTLANAVEALLAGGQKHILLNLDGVQSVSARTLGDLITLHLTVQQRGGQFKLFNLTPMVRRLIQVTKLLVVFNLYENEKEALESFNLVEESAQ